MYYSCLEIKIDTHHVRYPTCGIYVLQSLQLQFSPVQHLIWFLKIGSVLACLTIFGKVVVFDKTELVAYFYKPLF